MIKTVKKTDKIKMKYTQLRNVLCLIILNIMVFSNKVFADTVSVAVQKSEAPTILDNIYFKFGLGTFIALIIFGLIAYFVAEDTKEIKEEKELNDKKNIRIRDLEEETSIKDKEIIKKEHELITYKQKAEKELENLKIESRKKLDDAITQKEKEITELKIKNEEKFEKEISEKQKEIENLKKQSKITLDREIQALKEKHKIEIDKLEKEIDKIKQEFSKVETQKDLYATKLNRIEKERNKLRKENLKLDVTKAQFEEYIIKKETEINRQKLTDMQSKLNPKNLKKVKKDSKVAKATKSKKN